MEGTCCACKKHGVVDRAHIRSKGAGGSWADENIIPLCRDCHSLSHQLGWYRFIQKYPKVEKILLDKGWEIEVQFGIPRLVRKAT